MDKHFVYILLAYGLFFIIFFLMLYLPWREHGRRIGALRAKGLARQGGRHDE